MYEISEREQLIDVALGKISPDLIIKGGNLVDVNTGEIYPANVAIKGRRIAAVGELEDFGDAKVIDARGRFLVPGFIDAHFHIESSMVTVTELAKVLVPRGVTGIVEDPHEMANVLGVRGIMLMLEEARNTPLRAFLRVPGQVPAVPGIETTGAAISLEETKSLLDLEDAVCLAGDINPNLILDKTEHLKKIQYAIKLHKTIGGQAPGLDEGQMNAFVCGGPEDSHVSANAEEALRKLRHGLKAILTPRSFLFGPKDFGDFAQVIKRNNLDTRNCLFCIDDKQTNILVREGHLDYVIRLAISKGFDPMAAYQMATINVADHYRIDRDFGSISPGKMADIVVLQDLESVRADKVFTGGKLVASGGKLVTEARPFAYPQWARQTIHLNKTVRPDDFEVRVDVKLREVRAYVMGIGLPKKKSIEPLQVRDGVVLPDESRDILSIAVLERHRGTGNVGRTFLTGTGIKGGAVASSVCHDHHNIVVVGSNNGDMAACANRLAEIGGGFVAAKDGRVLGQVELPIAGLMSDEPFQTVVDKLDELESRVKMELKFKLEESPFFWLAVVPLPNLPELGLTDKGLFDPLSFRIIDPIVGA